MGFPPMPSLEEAIFVMYINNLYCAVKCLYPFIGENNEEKRKERLNEFNRSVRRILANKKALMGEGKYDSLDEKESMLFLYCDNILDILFNRKKEEIKIKSDDDYVLFLNDVFDFFLSEKNLPNFINLIFSLVSGGSIFTKEGDYEKNQKWLDDFELLKV